MTGKQGQVEFRFEAGGKESFGLGLASSIGFFESQNFAQRPAEEIGKKLKEMGEGWERRFVFLNLFHKMSWLWPDEHFEEIKVKIETH